MGEPSRVVPASTFVIRFWREWSATTGRWRGRIEHVQSGQSADFLDLEGALDFVRARGVMVDSPDPSTQVEEPHGCRPSGLDLG